MAITELERSNMVQQLTETLGEKPAGTLTKCLVLDGADQLATKTDLDNHRLLGEADLALAKAELETAMAKQTRTLMLTMAGFMMPMWVALVAQLFG